MKRIFNFLIYRVFAFFSVKNLLVQKKPNFKKANLYFIAPQESEPTPAGIDDVFKDQLIKLQKDARMQAVETIANLYSGIIEPSRVRMRTLVCGSRSPVLRTIRPKFCEKFPSHAQENPSIDEAIYWESITGT
jgi:hypothetical protein